MNEVGAASNGAGEAYMLTRNSYESVRLDTQHGVIKELLDGHLVDPLIPLSKIRTVADVGTGTGIWLKDAAMEVRNPSEEDISFVGFDISAAQFPSDTSPHVTFVVHDVVEPFPSEYHEKFDLVHIRFLTFALKSSDLERAVTNVIDIIRPGGYLQWHETDAIDCFATPETRNARDLISFVVAERVARGLTPAITSPLIKTIQSLTNLVPEGCFSPLNWTSDLVRILSLRTTPSSNHRGKIVSTETKNIILKGAMQMLQAGVLRRQGLVAQGGLSVTELELLKSEANQMTQLVEACEAGFDPFTSEWNLNLTSIVGQKAFWLAQSSGWMGKRLEG